MAVRTDLIGIRCAVLRYKHSSIWAKTVIAEAVRKEATWNAPLPRRAQPRRAVRVLRVGAGCARGQLVGPRRIYEAAGCAHGVLRAAALDRGIRGRVDAARRACRAYSVHRGVARRGRILTRRTNLARPKNSVRRVRAVGDHEASSQILGGWEAHGILRHIAFLRQIISLPALAAVGANCLLRATARRAHILSRGA